jgi:hypothetical protein
MADKSIADVLDNTVNQLSNGVQALGNAIQKVAPNAWKIAVHQQQLLGGRDLVIGIGGLIVGLIGLYLTIYLSNKYKKDIWTADHPGFFFISLISLLVSMAFICFGWCNITNGYVQYAGAEYYAVKDILSIVK